MALFLIALLLVSLFLAIRWITAVNKLRSVQLDLRHAKRLALEIRQQHCQKYLDQKDLMEILKTYQKGCANKV